jgi:NAD(P)-dependent dehydrogenase (short-subunit alcohol dehydrogenase family)
MLGFGKSKKKDIMKLSMKSNRTAVVTGATGTIGSAISRYLFLRGWAVHEWQSDWNLENRMVFKSDTVPWKDVNLLVTAHGTTPVICDTESLSEADWDRIIAVDLEGTFFLAQKAGKYMIENGGGSMVFISSIHAIGTYPGRTAYAVAKAGVCALARSLAIEWGKYGVQVNALCPGQVEGKRTTDIASTEGGRETLKKMKRRIPSGSFISPMEIAMAVHNIVETPSITGTTIPIDNGLTQSFYYGDYDIKEPDFDA